MTRSLIALLAAGLLGPAAVGSPPDARAPDEKAQNITVRAAAKVRAEQDAERAEDIEVLRRILNRALGLPDRAGAVSMPQATFGGGNTRIDVTSPYYPLTRNVASEYYGPRLVNAVGPFDGVYLPGHGVVYTLRVPEGVHVVLDPIHKSAGLAETCLRCHTTVAKEDVTPAGDGAKTPTEWDETLCQIRGDRPRDPPKPKATVAQVCEPGRLTERVVEKLWKNGKHVRHLPATEHVTVAVTFDGYAGSSRGVGYTLTHYWEPIQDPANGGLRYERRQAYIPVGDPNAQVVESAPPATAATAPAPMGAIAEQTAGDRVAGFTEAEAKLIREGDQHLEAGRASQAVTAYKTALARVGATGPVRLPNTMLTQYRQRFPVIVENITKGVAEVRRKLSHALTAAGERVEAQRVLEAAATVTLEPADAARSPVSASPDKLGFTPEEIKLLTLGDLHLRQNKPREAADAYERALARYRDGAHKVAVPPTWTPAQVNEGVAELQKSVRGVYRQLAQAWLAAGETDKAQPALDLARTFTVEVAARTDAKAEAIPVPAKLVISVTRADLLKAADDLTAFRKLVTVETIGFPPRK